MIELKNVSKTYKSKKGKDTKALDNITLNFGNNGMTFILGKSGSGKSTLLNIIGGLDKYDSGDMVILGKSSKDFKQADFDSYRNTYIGFVFQEFNILEDYDVYENIILALQLQQKEINNEEIDKLLEQLELVDLKYRKVNELSGGQKQRVAIARALIKNPKIILADEPTGNLDSKTGKQVMDLLKEISKEKLVIIVSHDEESANNYGNRIIEIKDGNIISDSNKIEITNEKTNEYEIIKSKLPFTDSLKLGIGSLKHKKIKLIFTITLTMFSLILLSLVDTLSSYDVENAHAKLLINEKTDAIKIQKYKFQSIENYDYNNKTQVKINSSDINSIKSKIKDPIYQYEEGEYNTFIISKLIKINIPTSFEEKTDLYYGLHINRSDIVATNNIKDLIKEDIIGKDSINSNEVVIPNYIADLIIKYGIYENIENEISPSIFKPKTYEEIVNSNKFFYFGNDNKVKIVGIINYDLSEYQIFKDKKSSDIENNINLDNLYSNEFNLNKNNKYNRIYVNESFIANYKTDGITLLNYENIYALYSDSIAVKEYETTAGGALVDKEIEYFDGKVWKKTSKLSKNDVILSVKQLKGFDYENYKSSLSNYLSKNTIGNRLDLEKKFFVNYIKENDIYNKNLTLKVYANGIQGEPIETYENLNVIGVSLVDVNDYKAYNYFSNELMSKYKISPLNQTGFIIPIQNQNETKKLLKKFSYKDELSAQTPYSDEVLNLIMGVYFVRDVALWASLVFLIFACILIANFMVNSINYRKKEIGVLRSLGARTNDVIKIFSWEGIALSIISGTFASIGLVLVSNLFNNVLMQGFSMILMPFILGVRQFVLIYFLVFIVTIISSIIPINRISKMKPIDAILNK